MAAVVLAEARVHHRLPILLAGRSLRQGVDTGLSAVPPIPVPPDTRDVRARLERDGVVGVAFRTGERDPVSAERLQPRDRNPASPARGSCRRHRGRPLTDWHGRIAALLPHGHFSALFSWPDREQLYARIDARFETMLARARWRSGGLGGAASRSVAACR